MRLALDLLREAPQELELQTMRRLMARALVQGPHGEEMIMPEFIGLTVEQHRVIGVVLAARPEPLDLLVAYPAQVQTAHEVGWKDAQLRIVDELTKHFQTVNAGSSA